MGKRASKLMAFQLHKMQASRVVSKIKHPHTNTLVVQPQEIGNAFATYYGELYKMQQLENKTEKINTFLDNLKL